MKQDCIFVTGTNTDSGKTVAAQWLLLALPLGLKVQPLKPIASGCEQTADGLRNSDAMTLWQAQQWRAEQANLAFPLSYAQVNPLAFEPAIAPHIAAQLAQQPVTVPSLVAVTEQARRADADMLLVEGAGGWQLPLNAEEFMPSYVQHLQAGVVLVVGMQLGCLNHALLTVQAIAQTGCSLVGWIANQTQPEPMPYYQENLAFLQQHINAPLLAELPFHDRTQTLAVTATQARRTINTAPVLEFLSSNPI